MRKRSSGLDEEDLSGLIGKVYDCAIDPTRWGSTLDRIRTLLNCANAAIGVTDMDARSVRFQKIVGIEPDWAARMPDYAGDVAEMVSSVAGLMRRPLDEPIVVRREFSDEAWLSQTSSMASRST